MAIAPEKDDIFITVNVDEGAVYKISEIKMAGNMVVPESELRRLIMFQPGDTYSLRRITQTQEAMKLRLGVDGYAFASVDPVPTPNNDTKEISLTFVVDPKTREIIYRGKADDRFDYGLKRPNPQKFWVAEILDGLKDLGSGLIRLVRSTESFLDSDEPLFGLPNVVDDENSDWLYPVAVRVSHAAIMTRLGGSRCRYGGTNGAWRASSE